MMCESTSISLSTQSKRAIRKWHDKARTYTGNLVSSITEKYGTDKLSSNDINSLTLIVINLCESHHFPPNQKSDILKWSPHLHLISSLMNMAQTNVTEDENQKTFIELFCSAEFIRGVDSELIFLSAINIFLSITAFLGNTLILVALHKETSLHPPSKLLYRNLAITDLCVGIIVEPLYVTNWTSIVKERWDVCYYSIRTAAFSGYTLCVVSALTLTAISVDRLLALLLGLRYRQVVTLRRTRITVISFWILSIVGASTIIWNLLIFTWYQYIVAALCPVTTIFAYTKIFFTLRHNQIHVQNHVAQGQPSQAIPLNIARYRKAVYSALWVQGTMVVCYLPFTIVVALMPQRGIPISAYRAWHFTATLVYLNSSLNPLLYCWKISEVRQAVKETLRKLFCRSS